jgi:hypothetical protein
VSFEFALHEVLRFAQDDNDIDDNHTYATNFRDTTLRNSNCFPARIHVLFSFDVEHI